MLFPRSLATLFVAFCQKFGRYSFSSVFWKLSLLLGINLAAGGKAWGSGTVVFNELLYQGKGTSRTEWIELHNLMGVDLDISGWSIRGVGYTFPEGTIFPGKSFLVVVGPSEGLSLPPSIPVFGPAPGRLKGEGDRLEILNNNGRIMDSVRYASRKEWPVGPAGSGVSLAKIKPAFASNEPESWRASRQVGGTPGEPNFPEGKVYSGQVLHFSMSHAWRFYDGTADLPLTWKETSFSDAAWPLGEGLFYVGTPAASAPLKTGLPAERTTYYFRTRFDYAGGTDQAVIQINAWIDDGAVFYLNGTEIHRFNLPAGLIEKSTKALQPQGNLSLLSLTLPASSLVTGQNVLAVEVHQAGSLGLTQTQPTLVQVGGTLLNPNLSRGPGAAPFAKDVIYFGVHPFYSVPHLTDGIFGDGNSWIGDSTNSFAGVSFGPTPIQVGAIAWGRDNSGQAADRTAGRYIIEYTTVPNPSATTTQWETIGSMNYLSQGSAGSPISTSLRHLWSFPPVSATGIRLRVPPGVALDELEAGPYLPPPWTLTQVGGQMRSNNLARSGTAFAKDALPGYAAHSTPHLNDGVYGNNNSWIGASESSWAGIRWATPQTITRVAFGRDNTGTYSDRAQGTYLLQVTQDANPEAPQAIWTTIAPVMYDDSTPQVGLRHEYEFNPVTVTAIRLFVPGNGLGTGAAIDELEVYLEPADLAFGAELSTALEVPAPLTLSINEVGLDGATPGFIELYNFGTADVPWNGVALLVNQGGPRTVPLPIGSLAPGSFAVVPLPVFEESLLGAEIFLMNGSQTALLDAIDLEKVLKGRIPDGTGPWRYLPRSTAGSINQADLFDQIVINEILYHTADLPAEPAQVTTNAFAAFDGPWKFLDAGPDPPADWVQPAFNDQAWTSGNGVFYFGTSPLPVSAQTSLRPGRVTSYFRKTFSYSTSDPAALLSLRHIVDDGAVFYLNGEEIERVNMPFGNVTSSTLASRPILTGYLSEELILPVEKLRPGINVLAVEVHQAGNYSVSDPPPDRTSAGFTINPSPTFSMTWDGNDGEFHDPTTEAASPDNLARASRGAVAFGSSQYGGVHQIPFANDGRYGNANSWLANIAGVDAVPYIGIRFPAAVSITNISWGRDNGNHVTDPCGGGSCKDRCLGTYTIQFTTVANPGADTLETGMAATGWATLATVSYLSEQTDFRPYLRHRFKVASGSAPVSATAIRIKISDINLCIDEVEVNSGRDVGHADVLFGAELATRLTTKPALPVRDSLDSWVELHNRSAATVDLAGWRLDEGIDYRFPQLATIPPGGFLVVAKDVDQFKLDHPGVSVFGPFTNRLSHRSDRVTLKDPLNNPVDTVRYLDGGRWPNAADGGGSSLELIDPRSDNSIPESWAASDESGRAQWKTYTYRGIAEAEPSPSSTQWKEFVLGLLDAGELYLDDVSVIESPGGLALELIQNGNFESGLNKWRVLGNHHGEVIVDPANPANHVLHLTATGVTDDMHNHVETTFAFGLGITNGREYQVSFRARWISGSSLLNSRFYYNRLPRTTHLETPQKPGTPGKQNSRYRANLGPTFSQLRHSPAVPLPLRPIPVSVEARDPDQVATVTLWWRTVTGSWSSLPMSPSAGRYAGEIPGQTAGALLQFYVEAIDAKGASAVFPPGGPASRALIRVEDGQAPPGLAKRVRLLLTPEDADFLFTPTQAMSNDRLGATLVYEEEEVFYDVGVRLKGSQSGRPLVPRVGFNVEFNSDQPFRGNILGITLDRSGGWRFNRQFGQEEVLIKHIVNRAGGISGNYPDLVRLVAPRSEITGSAMLQMDAYSNQHLDSDFQDGADGLLYEYDAAYISLETVDGNPESLKKPHPYGHPPGINSDILDLGNNKESYRWHFRAKNHRRLDDYNSLIAFAKTFSLGGEELDRQTQRLMDVDEWMRVFAIMSLTGAGDTYTQGNNHNIRLYVRPKDGKMLVFPWDWDFAFFLPVTSALSGNMNLQKIIAIPGNRRLFLGHMLDVATRVYHPGYLTYWADHYDDFLPGQDFSSIVTYAKDRREFVLSQMPPKQSFKVTTGGGQDFTTNVSSVLIEGTAWIDVREVVLPGLNRSFSWTSLTNWQVQVPLVLGENILNFEARNFQGKTIFAKTVKVTTSQGATRDTDADGLPDSWEERYGLDLRTKDANLDPDGDGATNLEEYAMGTDPRNAGSHLFLEGQPVAEGFLLRFEAEPSRAYAIEYCEDLEASSWILLEEVPALPSRREMEVLDQTDDQPRFYRLRVR